MTQVTVHDDLEPIKVLLASDNLEAKQKFIDEVVESQNLLLLKILIDNNLIHESFYERMMIYAIKGSNILTLRFLYSRDPFKGRNYVLAAAIFKQSEPLLFFGIYGEPSDKILALVFLASLGRLDHVKTLVDLGVPVNQQAFSTACSEGHFDLINFFLDMPSINVDFTDGLCSAIWGCQHDVIRYLVNLDKPIDYIAAATTAGYQDNPDLLQQMLTLAKDKQPEVTFLRLSHVLEQACSKGYHKVIDILLKTKVPLTAEVYSMMSTYNDGTKKLLADKVIQVAILKKDLDMIEYLKEYLDQVDLDSALKRAVLIAKDPDMVKTLTSSAGHPFNLDQAITHAISVDSLDILTYLTTIGSFDVEAVIQFATLKGCDEGGILEHLKTLGS